MGVIGAACRHVVCAVGGVAALLVLQTSSGFAQDIRAFYRAQYGGVETARALSPTVTPGTEEAIAAEKVGASGRSLEIAVSNVLSEPIQTTNEIQEQKEAEAQSDKAGTTQSVRLRTYYADAYVEAASLSGAKTTTAGVTVGAAMEFNDFTIGAMVPLDYLWLPGGDAQRFGVMAYGQYNWRPSKGWSIKPTVFANYIYTAVNVGGLPNIGTAGGGAGLSVSYDSGKFIPGLTAVITYNKDDTGFANNHQTLFAIGPRLGFRPHNDWVLEAGVLYNKDISNYIPTGVKDYYFDVDAGISYRASKSFRLDLSYRTTLGIANFSSHRFMVGGRFAF